MIGAGGHEFLQEPAQEQQDGHHGSRRILANGNRSNGSDGDGNVRSEVALPDSMQSRPLDLGGAHQGSGQIEDSRLVLSIIVREEADRIEEECQYQEHAAGYVKSVPGSSGKLL